MLVELLRPFLSPLFLRLPQPKLRVNRITIRIPDLDPRLDGLTIAHISDLHVGEGDWLPKNIDEAAAAVRDSHPDLVVNTGDFIRHQPPLQRVFEIARRFSAPDVPHLAVLGNHDYYAGDDVVVALKGGLENLGIRVLENEASDVTLRGVETSIAGLSMNADGFDAALQRILESPRPPICLFHEPDLAERLPEGSADLVLAGHTHGGQIAIPWLTRLIVRRFSHSDYVSGLYRVNDNPVYVNSGLGFTGLPLRAGASPEVAILRLTL